MAKDISKAKLNIERLLKIMCMSLIPVLSCIFLAAIQKMWLTDIYLPNSQFNDEIMYYKQIEGAAKYGAPWGYFGYNESHAALLSFSSWSPVIIYPYVIIAKIIGFGMAEPYVINVLFVTLAFASFAIIYKPKWVDIFKLGGIFIMFIPLSRLMLSVMSDSLVISLSIVYLAVHLKCEKDGAIGECLKNRYIVWLYILSAVLTMMRPYFLLLFLFPGIYAWKKNKKSVLLSVCAAVVSVAVYFYISNFFTAAYYFPLINTDWIKGIIESPISGIRMALSIFAYACRAILKFFVSAPLHGMMEESLWVIFVILGFYIFIRAIKNSCFRCWFMLLLLITGAVIMFYVIGVGSRHLIPFLIMAFIFVALDERLGNKSTFVLILLIIFIFTGRVGQDTYNYRLPKADDSLAADIDNISQACADMLDENASSKWDNTIIWVWTDNKVMIRWNELYGLPAGIGINMCTPEYALERFKDLNARYIASIPDGEVAVKCLESGAEIVAVTDDLCIWRLR